jgi:ribosomal-protein-alanine N-acetyltransferase
VQDAEALLQILQEENILQYFPASPPPSIERVNRYIAHHLAHWQERGYGHWAVTLRQDGRLLGWNGLEYLPDTDETEVAYLLSHQAWGRGYATQTARLAVRFGFETAGLEQIIGLVHPDNFGSIRVLEKCGLKPIDRKVYWGLELERYRIGRQDFQ